MVSKLILSKIGFTALFNRTPESYKLKYFAGPAVKLVEAHWLFVEAVRTPLSSEVFVRFLYIIVTSEAHHLFTLNALHGRFGREGIANNAHEIVFEFSN